MFFSASLVDEISILRARELLKKPPSYPKWSLLPVDRLDMPFVGREAQLISVVNSAVSALEAFTDARRANSSLDRKKLWFPAFFVSAGRGKTRFAVELERYICSSSSSSNCALSTVLGSFSSMAVVSLSLAQSELLSYASLCKSGVSADCVMGALILASYLHCHLKDVPLVSVHGAIRVISEHQNPDASVVVPTAPLCLFVLIDEVSSAGAHHVTELVKAAVAPTFAANEPHFVFPVLFGTHSIDRLLDFHLSSCVIVHKELPLLSADDVLQLVELVAQRSQHQPAPAYRIYGAYKKCQAFQQLITDAGGWPRGLDVILSVVTAESRPACLPVEQLDFSQISVVSGDCIRKLYQSPHVPAGEALFPMGALLHILTGLPIANINAKIPGSQITFVDLATRRALAVLVDDSGIYRLESPFLWIQAMVKPLQHKELKPLERFWSMLCNPESPSMGWNGFEAFCGAVLVMRLAAARIAEQQQQQVALSSLLYGVKWLSSVPHVALSHPSEPSVVGALAHRFPCASVKKARKEPLDKSYYMKFSETNLTVDIREQVAMGQCGINASGAPFADVILPLWQHTAALPYLVLLQMKYYKSTAKLTNSDIKSEYNKCANALDKCGMTASFAGWSLIVITTATHEDTPYPWNLRANTHVAIVSASNFKDFFGMAFTSRAVFSSKLDRSLAFLCAADVQQLTGVSTPSARKFAQHRDALPSPISDEAAIDLFPEEDRMRVRRKLNFQQVQEEEKEEEGDDHDDG